MSGRVTEIRANRVVEVTAAQWRDQPRSTWPAWWSDVVIPDNSAINPYGALLLFGGDAEPVKYDEWLVRDAEGRVSRMSDRDFRTKYIEIL